MASARIPTLDPAARIALALLQIVVDGVANGDHPQAKPVFDLDCMTLLDVARTLRDEHRFQSGRKITYAPRVFLGAAENPFTGICTLMSCLFRPWNVTVIV